MNDFSKSNLKDNTVLFSSLLEEQNLERETKKIYPRSLY
jgi:hypothetical protein